MAKLKKIEKFDNDFFGLHSKSAETMDPQLRILLEVVYEAVVDAGIRKRREIERERKRERERDREREREREREDIETERKRKIREEEGITAKSHFECSD